MQFDSTTNSGRASIIEAYKIAVSENAGRLSFKSFCDVNGIFDSEKILWWCRDRQISVKKIQQSVTTSYADIAVSPSIVQVHPSSMPRRYSASLSGISITFPDGVNLSLQEGNAEGIADLLAIYRSRCRMAGGM